MTQVSLYLFSHLEIIWNLHSISITPNMVKKVIMNLDLSKMSSHYYIPFLVLKNFLTYQLNSWISVWKSLVFQIFGRFHWWSPHLKILGNGKNYTAKNCHPVNHLSVVSKVFGKLINNRIIDQLMLINCRSSDSYIWYNC